MGRIRLSPSTVRRPRPSGFVNRARPEPEVMASPRWRTPNLAYRAKWPTVQETGDQAGRRGAGHPGAPDAPPEPMLEGERAPSAARGGSFSAFQPSPDHADMDSRLTLQLILLRCPLLKKPFEVEQS